MSSMKKGEMRNKLSRTYKFKKKTGKVKRKTENIKSDRNYQARIVVRNLSFQVTEEQIRKLYEPFGEIEEVVLLKRPDGKLVGCGFVQFKKVESASKAIFKTNKSNFLGRIISSEFSIPKTEFCEKLNKKNNQIKEEENETEKQSFETDNEKTVTTNKKSKRENKSLEHDQSVNKNHINDLKKKEEKKLRKLASRKKKARVIIRNLPFSVTPESIQERFSKYGIIEEIRILKKPDGSFMGCAFVQFERVQSAAQAVHYENLKEFDNRKIVVDRAISKKVFESFQSNIKPEIKFEGEDADCEVITETKEQGKYEINIKEEELSDEEVKEENISAEESSVCDSNNSDSLSESDSEEKNNKSLENSEVINENLSHPQRISNDVNEGRTVFIKNVPFSAKNEDLKQCMEQFGPVLYALVCIDPMTEHSKGTAFVKFKYVEDAEKCLSAGTELRLHDEILDPHKALNRKDVQEKKIDSKEKTKDSRNLYLVKEGVILASSPAAKEVSAADMSLRLRLEQWKSQMLRNLNMFVSKVRLVIHNLPPDLDDVKLREIFKKYSEPKAVITEARVMRDLRNMDANGVGKSKGYGFVSFTSHEDALKVLRKINNNPNVFTRANRPVVAFSIENRLVLNAKQKRLDKSRENNPLWKKRKSREEEGEENNKKSKNEIIESNEDDYAGTSCSKPGSVKKLSSKFFLKKQAEMHSQNLKNEKKKKKLKKQKLESLKQRKNKEPKVKKAAKKQDEDEQRFSNMVNEYKNKLSTLASQKSKWYEE